VNASKRAEYSRPKLILLKEAMSRIYGQNEEGQQEEDVSEGQRQLRGDRIHLQSSWKGTACVVAKTKITTKTKVTLHVQNAKTYTGSRHDSSLHMARIDAEPTGNLPAQLQLISDYIRIAPPNSGQ
jgi:hypothetical protein